MAIGGQLVERARQVVRSLTDLSVLDATTVLALAVACMLVGRKKGMPVEDVAEMVKRTIVDQVERLEGRSSN